MRIEQVKVVVKVKDDAKGENRKAYDNLGMAIDGFFQFYGEKPVVRGDTETVQDGRHPGKDIVLGEEVMAEWGPILMEWDASVRRRYKKGLVYMANYGIDLSERSRIQGENRKSQAKPNPTAIIGERIKTDLELRQRYVELIMQGTSPDDAAKKLLDEQPGELDVLA